MKENKIKNEQVEGDQAKEKQSIEHSLDSEKEIEQIREIISKKVEKKQRPRLIKKVIRNSGNGQLLVTIPKETFLKAGDFVELIVVPEPKKGPDGEYLWKN